VFIKTTESISQTKVSNNSEDPKLKDAFLKFQYSFSIFCNLQLKLEENVSKTDLNQKKWMSSKWKGNCKN